MTGRTAPACQFPRPSGPAWRRPRRLPGCAPPQPVHWGKVGTVPGEVSTNRTVPGRNRTKYASASTTASECRWCTSSSTTTHVSRNEASTLRAVSSTLRQWDTVKPSSTRVRSASSARTSATAATRWETNRYGSSSLSTKAYQAHWSSVGHDPLGHDRTLAIAGPATTAPMPNRSNWSRRSSNRWRGRNRGGEGGTVMRVRATVTMAALFATGQTACSIASGFCRRVALGQSGHDLHLPGVL